jgi:hypothetical protein
MRNATHTVTYWKKVLHKVQYLIMQLKILLLITDVHASTQSKYHLVDFVLLDSLSYQEVMMEILLYDRATHSSFLNTRTALVYTVRYQVLR